MLVLLLGFEAALSPPSGLTQRASRRSVIAAPLAAPLASLLLPPCPAVAADAFDELTGRLEMPVVPEAGDGNAMQGKPEPKLPAWLAGRWRCEQTLTAFTTPLGVQYIGAPGRPISEAEASAAETRAQIGKPVALELRFDAVQGGAVESRAFNARSRLDAFAGRPITRASQPCALAGVDSPGLACTYIDFTGPVVQKQIVNSMRVAARSTDAVMASLEYCFLVQPHNERWHCTSAATQPRE